MLLSRGHAPLTISIHALREESDAKRVMVNTRSNVFQSTLSVRRATGAEQNQKNDLDISIHALREESDPLFLLTCLVASISIHALREESDYFPFTCFNVLSIFQSTLSVRRATRRGPSAIRAGYFNPRSP